MKKYGRYIFIATVSMALYLAVLFFCTLYDFSDTGISIGHMFLGIRSDKWIHFAMFFPYPFVCRGLLSIFYPFRRRRHITSLTIFVSGVLLAAITELFQFWFTDYRSMDFYDSLADVIGVMSAVLVSHYLFHYMLSAKKSPATSH